MIDETIIQETMQVSFYKEIRNLLTQHNFDVKYIQVMDKTTLHDDDRTPALTAVNNRTKIKMYMMDNFDLKFSPIHVFTELPNGSAKSETFYLNGKSQIKCKDYILAFLENES